MQVTHRPNALISAALTRKGWIESATSTCFGWSVVTSEVHRVTLVKGNDLVHIAPAGADFDNPIALSESEKTLALKTAIVWAKAQSKVTA